MRASCGRGFVSVLLTMSAVAACSSPTVPPAFTSPGLTSFKSVTVSPRPASAQPTGNADAPWHVEFTVTVRETRGVGIEVYAVTVGSFSEHTFDTDDILAAAGVNRIGPRESLDIPLGFFYSTESGGPAISTVVVAHCTDENGFNITGSTNLTVLDE